MSTLHVLPCLDSEEMGMARREVLDIPRNLAASLGRSAVNAARVGHYESAAGAKVDWSEEVEAACGGKVSISPDATLPASSSVQYPETRVQISNETTLGASQRITEVGLRPLALNFANGIRPGGGFLNGARAQEETLCRSSALYQTLLDDPMYQAHSLHNGAESSDWAIYSPNVPIFRNDAGVALERPWTLNFLTCAAPYAPTLGLLASGDLLKRRILRILAIARAYNYSTLVLGAWGCGAFRNDPHRTATDFRQALEGEFSGAFSDIAFAITDWSLDRRTLGPFKKVFTAGG